MVNTLTAIKADVLSGEFKFKRENGVHFEAFSKDYLEHCRTNKKHSVSREENSIKFLVANFGGTVKGILGHTTIQMTMRYAHPAPENKRHAVEVVARLFSQSRSAEELAHEVPIRSSS